MESNSDEDALQQKDNRLQRWTNMSSCNIWGAAVLGLLVPLSSISYLGHSELNMFAIPDPQEAKV